LHWLRTLTIDQWHALCEQYPVRQGSSRETLALFGLYVVAALCLMFTDYAASELWRLAPVDLVPPSVEWKYWRKMGWVWGSTFGYMFLPMLYARYVMGMRMRDMGFRADGFVKHLPLYFAFLGLVLPCVVWVSNDHGFLNTYPLNKMASQSLGWLVLWEVSYAIQFVGVETFFRGFLLFGPARQLGAFAVPVMLVPYCMLHFQKPWLEAFGSILAGIALGVVALRTKSILAGICIHAIVAWSMDMLALLHRGELQSLGGG
jgi:branched-subunit amino acid transport protein